MSEGLSDRPEDERGAENPAPRWATRFSRLWGATTARTARFADWPGARYVQRLVTVSHIAAYRRLGGGFVGYLGAAPILLLTTTGRRTGKQRTTPLIYIDAEEPALVASNGGAARHPLWYRNLLATPEAVIELGRERRQVVAETVTGAERERLWRAAVEIYPAYASYQQQTEREIPVVALRRARA